MPRDQRHGERADRAAAERDRLAAQFDRLHPFLYRLARRMLRDPEEARDLVQEAFLQAARNPAGLPSEDDGADAWLTRVLVNLCRDRHRRLAVRRRTPPSSYDLHRGGEAPDPESRALARDAVETALAELPPRRRAVLVLRDLEELSTAEVARRLGLARATVRWHLMAARKDVSTTLRRQTATQKGAEDDD